MVMNREPLTLSPQDYHRACRKSHCQDQVHSLPGGQNGNLVGILTPTDLLYEVEKKASGIPVEELALSPCVPIYQEAPSGWRSSPLGPRVNALPVLDANAAYPAS
jgi:predicted transcriptional regulator